MASGKRGGPKPPPETDLKERLNAEIRAAIAAIDGAPGPLRARVARASEQVIRILMPRAPDEPGHRRGNHDAEPRSHLVSFASAPAATVHDAQASVLAEFTRSLLETDFRRGMAEDGARPFGYLVRCVKNRAIELWRTERGLERRHDSAAGDAALAPDLTGIPGDYAAGETEEIAEKLAEIAQRVPLALEALDRDELLLLLLSAVLRLHRDRIGEVLGTTSNTVGQRLSRLRDRLHPLVHDGRARAPDPRRARGGKASARKRAAARRSRFLNRGRQ
ncbi:MAG: hypothetical protein E6J91_47975 [Deltaproteobacteria bacterium]|nr:MAG: hypothetical protein E6J91_47975 [Deltaproteobacteria bacterium]